MCLCSYKSLACTAEHTTCTLLFLCYTRDETRNQTAISNSLISNGFVYFNYTKILRSPRISTKRRRFKRNASIKNCVFLFFGVFVFIVLHRVGFKPNAAAGEAENSFSRVNRSFARKITNYIGCRIFANLSTVFVRVSCFLVAPLSDVA